TPGWTAWGCQRKENRRWGSMRSTVISNVLPAYGSCILAISASAFVGAMTPRSTVPATNGPSNLAPNHSPNSIASVSAFHTRAREAFSNTRFSIRSVTATAICNLLVAYASTGDRLMQPDGCMSTVVPSRADRPVLDEVVNDARTIRREFELRDSPADRQSVY